VGRQVICYIQAFDCKETIEDAMKSVLEQTYENWRCFVLANGSQFESASLETMKNFAARDRRFVVLNKKYNLIDVYIPMLYHLAHCFPESYICSLDSDDAYKNDFFARAVSLAEKHQLDIVACGTEILLKRKAGAKKETLLSRREAADDFIVRQDEFTHRFKDYKPFFNEMWGKLYDAKLFAGSYGERYAQEKFFCHFLPDTLFTFDNLSRSAACGILGGTSHKFYQFQQRKSTNATVMSNAVAANHRRRWGSSDGRKSFSVYDTYDTLMSFLRSHGEITAELYEYMQAVLFGWFGDFYTRTLLLTTDEENLADHAFRLVFHPKFDEIMRYEDSGRYDNLRNYEKRKDFCELLRDLLRCQEIIGNREERGRIGLSFRFWTRRKIEKIVKKLDDTIETLSKIQPKEN